MSQVKILFSAALLLVSGISLAEGRIDAVTQSMPPAAGVLVVPDLKTGSATIYELDEIDPRLQAAKDGKLSKEEETKLQEEIKTNLPKNSKKIGEMPLAREGSGRDVTSIPACGFWNTGWGGYGGWGFAGYGYGFGYGYGVPGFGYGNFLYGGVSCCNYGYGFGGGYYGGYYGGYGLYW